ncbi:hypothetical protein ACGFJC_47220 [Nonomuraea fuscirosea]|uniref:hypothetical protein n=1 Tax=Nonomuraea fuscirosea TaxID=1291556 RepID=UPI003718E9C6
MVHRLEKLVPEAWARAGRTLLQSVLSVAAVAVGPALVTAAGGGVVDVGALGIAGGQAALAAALAYLHNWMRPTGGRALGETTWRAGRTLLQNLMAAVAVPGAAAIATTGGDDWQMLGMAGLQAGAAGLIALLHNWVSPRTSGDGPAQEPVEEPVQEPVQESAEQAGDAGDGLFGDQYGGGSGGDGYRPV